MFNFKAFSGRSALVSPTESVSYEELEHSVLGFNNWFKSRNIESAPLLVFPTVSSAALYLGAFHSAKRLIPIGLGLLANEPKRFQELLARSGIFISQKDFEENKARLQSFDLSRLTIIKDEELDFSGTLETSHPEIAFHTSSTSGRGTRAVLTKTDYLPQFFDWCRNSFDLSAKDRFVLIAPFHFDMSLFDFFVPLELGASLLLPKPGTFLYPELAIDFFKDQRPTVVHSVPSVWTSLVRKLTEDGPASFSSVKRVLFAGDIFPEFFLETLKPSLPEARFFNVYGQTEANSYLSAEIKSKSDLRYPPVLGDRKTYSNVSVNDDGELVVAGPNVAQGYLSADYQTFEPFKSVFHTGDLVSKEGGKFHFLGRKDAVNQLKTRCESNAVNGIIQSVVAYQEGRKPVLVFEPVDQLKISQLQEKLRSMHPDFEDIIPRFHLPLTYNGKPDTNNLL